MDIRPLGSVFQTGSTPPSAPEPATTGTGTPVSTGSAPIATTQATVAQPAAAVQPEPSSGQVNNAVKKINDALAAQSQGIEFAIDSSSSHRIIVKVVDQQTNKVIRQFPSKEALAIADSLDQAQRSAVQQGLLIKQQGH